MGANNCKSAEDVDYILDNVFALQYAQLIIFSVNITLPATNGLFWMPSQGVYLALTVFNF